MDKKLKYPAPVTLAGGGDLDAKELAQALKLAPHIIAADGGAQKITALGHRPDAIIGDMDSLSEPDAWKARTDHLIHLSEQDTTDFEKCLYTVEAPAYIGVGLLGRRTDHALAVLHSMLRFADQKIVLLGQSDAIALVPKAGLSLSLHKGARISFFPLVPAQGVQSSGLRWPIDRLAMQIGRQIGTSNEADQADVSFQFDRAGVLVITDARHVGMLMSALA